MKNLTPDQILEQLEKDELNLKVKQEDDKKNKIQLQTSENFELPNSNQLKRFYGHIKSLRIEIYIIETKTDQRCGYCEAWKNNKLERKYFNQLHKLLGLDESVVMVSEVPCDWNCLHATEYKDENGIIRNYPTDIDIYGENYFYAYGMDIEYFPAIRIILESEKYENGKKKFESIFQGLGMNVIKRLKYRFNGKEYYRNKGVPEVQILKPLMRFLKSLIIENMDIPIHEKFSIFLGQFHRHIDQ